MQPFISTAYQKQKSFAGFLPGIAGKEGLPLWVFYVNRGQAISSFGVRDKNGAITEFYPANLAYAYVHQHGFRTFLKFNNEVFECFHEKNTTQTMAVDAHQIILEETIVAWNIKVRVTYATLPNMPLSALMRQVDIINLDQTKKEITMIDGLSQMLPAGIDYGGYKAISNLLQSWMEVEEHPEYVLLKLRASTADSSEVQTVENGNFYRYIGLDNAHYIYDYKAVFGQDSAFQTPYQLRALNFEKLTQQKQAPVNQVPSAFVAAKIVLHDAKTFYGVFGYTHNQNDLAAILAKFNREFLQQKFLENNDVIANITQDIETRTSEVMFDDYLKQCYLDNVLRGGYPLVFKTLDGDVAYHIYSRKHGDLERDYNFFSLEPSFISQGNGAFRDVLQNRRNDLYFHPEAGLTTIAQFASFFQIDGYNPLSIEGIMFTYEGQINQFSPSIQAVLKGEFTPGQIATLAQQEKLAVMDTVANILSQSHYAFKATFGEGYWGDHFTYFVDLLETYQDIYPDQMVGLFSHQYPYFVSPANVKKRDEKYVLNKGKVRQYHAIHHNHQLPPRGWLKTAQGDQFKTSLFAKMLTLVATKFANLDPEELGLMYEAERPGWNDAMNGLPGLFGSGVSELIELLRLTKFILAYIPKQTAVASPLVDFIHALQVVRGKTAFERWQERNQALETYRDQVLQPLTLAVIDLKMMQDFLTKVEQTLSQSMHALNTKFTIIPTYFAYEVSKYQVLPKKDDSAPTFIRIEACKRIDIPYFLEAPARFLSAQLSSAKESFKLYQAIKQSPIYDTQLKIYKTSESLEHQSLEIGRIRAFTPGWLERESAFLHMTYKYQLGLLKANLYDEFFATMREGMTCFMDPLVYGRSPLENSSFIATSNNPDLSKHGQGFFARLSGSTAEVLSMWKRMMFGENLFSMKDGQLRFTIKPILPKAFFRDGKVETLLFSKTNIIIHYQGPRSTYDASVSVSHYELIAFTNHAPLRVEGPHIQGSLAEAIRQKQYAIVHVYLKGGTH